MRFHYPAFGSAMSDLSYTHISGTDTAKYRYGFNNQEKDNELGDYYAFEYRVHDARLGRFLSVDPVSRDYPWNSTYAFAENDLIRCIDLEGLEKLALAGFVPPNEYRINNSYTASNVKAFKAQADRLSKICGVTSKSVSSANEIMTALKEETKNHGSISFVATFTHSDPRGLFLRDGLGLYFNEVTEIKNLISSNQIKFTSNAIWFIDGCNSADPGIGFAVGLPDPYAIAQEITMETGVTTIAAKGHMEMVDPKDANGQFKISDKDKESYHGFYKIVRETKIEQKTVEVPNPDYHWYTPWRDETIKKTETITTYKINTISLGRELRVDDYVPSN